MHSNELEEVGIISLDGVNVDSDPQKELLLGVCGYFLSLA
jgi:kinesin family protein 1